VLDVLVVGAGPAGYALARACAENGLSTAVLDPAPDRPWRATYGAWADELPRSLPSGAIAAFTPRARATALTEHVLERGYAVLDNDGLHDHLRHRDVAVHQGRAVAVDHDRAGSTVLVADGRALKATVVVDATGARRVLTGGAPRRVLAEQTAVGVIVAEDDARAIVAPDEALFMDWRPIPDSIGGWPTFLYAVPVGGGRVLVEETCLVRRPGLSLDVLRRRLRARLAAQGLRLGATFAPAAERDIAQDDSAQEWVRFPVEAPLPRPGRVISFGVAAAVIHPATGYSVASALGLAPRVAASIASALPHGPASASKAARHAVWPASALAVQGLRRRGMEAVLALAPDQVPAFFEVFFGLPEPLRAAYLSGREDLPGTAAAMITLFRRAPRRLRAHLVLASAGLRGTRPTPH
jgi:lycopene beta-cyclase